VSVLLRERFFGELDGQDDDAYPNVWSRDLIDPNHSEQGVESVSSVLARTTELLESLESSYRGQHILLVAHGDVLQILQTLFAGVSPAQHRQLPHLQVAEIRRLNSPGR
jgi:probable phosphoglycerate mutase